MLFSGQLLGQCVIDLAPAYCTNADAVYLPPLHEHGVMSGAGIEGDYFFPEDLSAGEYVINYNYVFGTQKYYLRAAVGEPWGNENNINAMNAAFGEGEWALAEFETTDPELIFSPATGFVFMDGSDDGAIELNEFLIANGELIENWVMQGGKLLMNSASNETVDLNFGFGGAELVLVGTVNNVTMQNPEHPILSGPNTPVNETMIGISYGHGYIEATDFTSILAETGDPEKVVLAERNWGNGKVIVGCMTTSNWHFPTVPAFNWRVNLLVYLNNSKKHYYIRPSTAEPWDGMDNPNAMDRAFGENGWELKLFETVDPEEVFNPQTAFVFLEGGDEGGAVLNAFLSLNHELIENWVHLGGSLFINAAPNGGEDIAVGFGGIVLNYGDPASSVEVADLDFPALIGPYVPTSPTMTGYSYNHSHVVGEGITGILTETGNVENIVLAQKEWGNGHVLVGGMTNPSFHLPELEANNWRSNLIVYANNLFDGFECSDSHIVEIVDLPEITLEVDKDSICYGDEITLMAEGADLFSWNDPELVNGVTYTPLSSGENKFIVTGEDAIGCASQDSVTVFVHDEITFEATTMDEIIGGDGEIDLTVYGGVGPFIYDWNIDGTGDFDDSEDLEGLTGGTYTFTVKDTEECSIEGAISVNSQLGIDAFSDKELRVYPNPTSSVLTLQLTGAFSYVIKDANERVILIGNAVDNATLNLDIVAKGIYFVTIVLEGEQRTIKVVKQ